MRYKKYCIPCDCVSVVVILGKDEKSWWWESYSHSCLGFLSLFSHPFFQMIENWGLNRYGVPWLLVFGISSGSHPVQDSTLTARRAQVFGHTCQPYRDAPMPKWIWTVKPLLTSAPPHLLKWNNRHRKLKYWCNSWASFFKRNCTPQHLVTAICWTST